MVASFLLLSPADQPTNSVLSQPTTTNNTQTDLIVMQLANKLGKDKDVQPMMIEGRFGVVLGAIGAERDHGI